MHSVKVSLHALFKMSGSISYVNLHFNPFREDWVAAIKMVSENLAPESEDVDMTSVNPAVEDLCEKFSRQGTSNSKSSGKRKVTLENFEFLKVLGKGTFGKVILCREKSTRRLFAIKILKKDVIIQKDEVAHTLTENRVLRSTNHPFLTVRLFVFAEIIINFIFFISP